VIPFYYDSCFGSGSGTVINYGSGSGSAKVRHKNSGSGSATYGKKLRFLRFRFSNTAHEETSITLKVITVPQIVVVGYRRMSSHLLYTLVFRN
jgi:hypothetical protein